MKLSDIIQQQLDVIKDLKPPPTSELPPGEHNRFNAAVTNIL